MLPFGDNEMKSDNADILQVDANNFQFGLYMHNTKSQATIRTHKSSSQNNNNFRRSFSLLKTSQFISRSQLEQFQVQSL